jgi:hypothetical protein
MPPLSEDGFMGVARFIRDTTKSRVWVAIVVNLVALAVAITTDSFAGAVLALAASAVLVWAIVTGRRLT